MALKTLLLLIKIKKILFSKKKIGAKYAFNLQKLNKLILTKEIKIKDIKFNIEASGNQIMMENAINNLSKTGKCIIAGNVKVGKKIKINP